MGYYAPDAEEVYNYIFRRERHSPRTLSDGFGWSILFVNDGSPVCKEFLSRYGVELCYRTADRVRFVFFSGLTREETHRLASNANGEWGIDKRIGFLPRILNLVGQIVRPRSKFDLERDQWSELRPEGLHPLDSRECIDRHLAMECEVYSAMPGAEEALRFAQKIGIGRFVPCFVLFSDLGNPNTCLFPIASKSPAEIFERLRHWIDSFYEINHVALKYWSDVEKSVETSCNEFHSTAYSLSVWRERKSVMWRDLQSLSLYQHRLDGTIPTLAMIREIENDYGLSWDTKKEFRVFREQLQDTEEKQAYANSVRQWASRISNARKPQSIYDELLAFKKIPQKDIPQSLSEAVMLALKLCKIPSRSLSPQDNITKWWKSENGRPLSKNKYDKIRRAWEPYSRKLYGSDAVGMVAKIRRDEFIIVSKAASSQLLNCEPGKAASNVIGALASHLKVSPDDREWQEVLAPYHRILSAYFRNLQEDAPAWLLEAADKFCPPLAWDDCIPAIDLIRNSRRKQWLPLLPRLQAALESSSLEWHAKTDWEEQRLNELRKGCIAEISSIVNEWLSASNLFESDKLSISLAFVSSLSSIRQDLENKIFSESEKIEFTSFPGKIRSSEGAIRLLKLFDDYDAAVRALSMPFSKDPEVMHISLDFDASLVPGKHREESHVSPAESTRKRLAEALDASANAVDSWNSTKQQALEWNPQGQLYSALEKILTSDRLSKFKLEFGINNHYSAITSLSNRAQIYNLLDQLSLQELLELERRIYDNTPLGASPPAVTKEQIYQSILAGIGLGWDSDTRSQSLPEARQLRTSELGKKVSFCEFDVFLAHNSEDQADVMRLGLMLRKRGIYPWIDAEQVPPGRWFQEVLQSAVRTVKAAAIIIGVSGVGRWQAVELRAFMSRCVEADIPIIPVLLPGISLIPEDLIFLREFSHVKFVNDVTEKEVLARFIWGITGNKVTENED